VASKIGVDDKLDKALVEGIRQGSLETVIRTLDAGADLECVDQYNFPGLPLRTACFLGHKEIVLELLRRGANPNAANSDGPDAPIRMAARGKRDEIVSILRPQAHDFPEAVFPDLNLPPIIAPASVAADAAIAAHSGPAATPPAAEPANTPGIEAPIETLVIGACYGVDTHVLEGDLLRLTQSDRAEEDRKSAEEKPESDENPAKKRRFW
jgi:hypothetical protein